MENKLVVAEQFYSIQGEGQTIGAPSYFLRLAGCNLMCGGQGTERDGKLHNGATWRCDSIEVWRKSKVKTMQEIFDDFGPNFLSNIDKGAHLVITGGEPLKQQAQVLRLIIEIINHTEKKPIFEVETNGTVEPLKMMQDFVTYWNVSPKLANSGEPFNRRINFDALNVFSKLKTSIFKWVISGEADLFEALSIMNELSGYNPRKIYFMPAASTDEELKAISPKIVEICKEYCYNYSHRVHISIWDKKTGV